MRILNIIDSQGEFVDKDTNRTIKWDKWNILCLDPNPCNKKPVPRRSIFGTGVYVCGNEVIQYKLNKSDLAKFYTGDIAALQTKDFMPFFDQNGNLIACTIK